MSHKIKYIFPIPFLIVFCTWLYFTPHLAVSGMRSAAEARDVAKLNEYINYPSLKESLKANFNAKLVSEVAKESGDNPFVVLGAAMVTAFIDPMIDEFVSPENLSMLMRGERLEIIDRSVKRKSSASDVETAMYYESFNRFVVAVKAKGSAEEPIGLIYTREGVFTWKLSALRLPI